MRDALNAITNSELTTVDARAHAAMGRMRARVARRPGRWRRRMANRMILRRVPEAA